MTDAIGPEIDSPAPGDPGTPPTGGEPGSDAHSGRQSATTRLRLAADELERRAAAATPGPWHPEYAYDNRPRRVHAVFVECDGEDCDHDRYGHADGTCAIGSFDLDGDNRWAILANPQLGRPLAAWLRYTADKSGRYALGHLACDEPLALADVILGSAR